MVIAINIHLKNGVLDHQGKAIYNALNTLGFNNITDARVGKQILLNIDTNNKEKAIEIANKTAKELLANPVIENYEIEVKSES